MKRSLRFHNKPSRKPSRKKIEMDLALRKHRPHIIVYSLLAVAIIAVRIYFPDAVDTAVGEVHTLLEDLKKLAKDGTTSILALVGFGYAVKELWKAFHKS